MFGMGFTEILLIAVVAIIFLGPDKLPQVMVDIARTMKKVKKAVANAKDSIEEEIHLSDIKDQALAYKQDLLKASDEIKSINPINNVKEALYDVTMEAPKKEISASPTTTQEVPPLKEEVTFKKAENTTPKENV